MSTMNMPGFTAETSLHKASVSYQHTAVWVNTANKQTVIAQMRKDRDWTCACDSEICVCTSGAETRVFYN